MAQDWISQTLGWTYFLAWSISFYPQLFLNYQRRSVKGLSIDFVYMNELGFLCYAIYTLAFFANPIVRDQYREKWHSDSSVQLNDVFFAVHALVLTTLTLLQTLWYSKSRQGGVSRVTLCLIGVAVLTSIVFGVLIATNVAQTIDYLYFLSLMKMAVTLLKYVPQTYLNYLQKSTKGWSMINVSLDFTGGILSLAQLFYDSVKSQDWTDITGNPIKFGLGFVSIIFDIIFFVQHFYLYPSLHESEEGRLVLSRQGSVEDLKFTKSNDNVAVATSSQNSNDSIV